MCTQHVHYIGATYVHRNYVGAVGRVGPNGALWAKHDRVQEAMRQCGLKIDPRWTASHQDAKGWKEASTPLEVFANSAADSAASWIAKRIAISQGERQDVRAADELVTAILTRIGIIEAHIAATKAWHPLPDRTAAVRPDPAVAWRRRRLAAGHPLIWTGGNFACRQCKAVKGPSVLRQWLQNGPCAGESNVARRFVAQEAPRPRLKRATQRVIDLVVPLLDELDPEELLESAAEARRLHQAAAGLSAHSSHRISVKGVWSWCRRCGAHTRGHRIVRLARPCERFPEGTAALRRVREGRPPLATCTDWEEPDPADGNA